MVDFSLTDEQLRWRSRAREFAAKHILPRTDLDTHGHFPRDLYEQAFREGFVTAAIPKEYGGGGKSLFDLVLAAEEFAYGDLGVATSTFLMLLATRAILGFGTDEQKERFIRPLTKELRFASHAWSEPEGSSNMLGRPATTTARPVDGGFVLNGTKSTISNATVASIYSVFARVDPGPPGLTCFVVPRDAKGVEATNPYRKMGQRAGDTGQVVFKDVFVPAGDQIGKIGQGAQIGLRSLRPSRVGVAAMSVGVARRARDLAKLFGHSRLIGDGNPLIQQQDFRFRLAEIETDIEMVRALTWRACWEVSSGPEATKFSSAAKLAGGNMASRVTNGVVEMLGASGYLESGLAEKLVRDSKVLQIYEGTGAIQKMLIADTVGRLGSLRSELGAK
ncbi:MAG: acyl-CoA/acyl-ACP dehydrogenase [Bdellovibrionales bacterium]|nr:acyl-CoA/acyl-ACP dehydrogenase [Bdellovibrionales bacterium]